MHQNSGERKFCRRDVHRMHLFPLLGRFAIVKLRCAVACIHPEVLPTKVSVIAVCEGLTRKDVHLSSGLMLTNTVCLSSKMPQGSDCHLTRFQACACLHSYNIKKGNVIVKECSKTKMVAIYHARRRASEGSEMAKNFH